MEQPQVSSDPLPPPQKKKTSLIMVLLGFVAVFLSVGLYLNIQTRLTTKAKFDSVLGSVQIDPGEIVTDPDSASVAMSALAYDTGGQPVWSGVSYTWGMSSAKSVGTVRPDPGNDKLATFEPGNVGIGDLFVTATNTQGQATGAIKVYVGVTPTPTPTPTPVPAPGALLNGSFEEGSGSGQLPTNWRRTNQSDTTDIRTNTFAHDGAYSFKFTGATRKIKTLTQDITHTWAAGTQLFIGGWLKTMNVLGNGRNRITVVARYLDNTGESFHLVFPSGASFDWTYRLGSLRLAKTTTMLRVKLEFSRQSGEGFYDAIILTDTVTGGRKYTKLTPGPATTEELK